MVGWEEALKRRRRKEGLVCVLNTSNHVCPYGYLLLLSLPSLSLSLFTPTTFYPYGFNCLLSSFFSLWLSNHVCSSLPGLMVRLCLSFAVLDLKSSLFSPCVVSVFGLF